MPKRFTLLICIPCFSWLLQNRTICKITKTIFHPFPHLLSVQMIQCVYVVFCRPRQSRLGRILTWCGSLKRKCLHFDEIFITGCTESCQNDNFQCSQWWKFRQNDDIFVSVIWRWGVGHQCFYCNSLITNQNTHHLLHHPLHGDI